MALSPATHRTTDRTTALLMTATVQPPPNLHALVRVDVASRIADYRAALQHNIGLLRDRVVDRIVLVDNSGYGTGPFRDIVENFEEPDRLEIYSYDGNEASASQSRLYGECRLIQHALKSTRTLGDGMVDRIWKITGRYIVRNIRSIIELAPRSFDLCVHCRDFPVKFVDFGLVGFGRNNADQALEIIATSNPQSYLDEGDLHAMIRQKLFGSLVVLPRLPRVPDFSGIRGYDNQSYDGVKYRAKFVLRSMMHRAVPGLWL